MLYCCGVLWSRDLARNIPCSPVYFLIPSCGVPWLLNPAQNIPWNLAFNESRPVVSRGYCIPPKICRGVPRVVGPVLWYPAGSDSHQKNTVESREYSRPRPTKKKNTAPNTALVISRAFLGTPFLLRDDIPRDSVTLGLNVTSCMGCGHRRACLCGNGIFTFSVAREPEIKICAGRVFAGTGLHMFITGLRDYPEPRTKLRDFRLVSTAVWHI